MFKSLFGFGPGCDIEFELDKSQTRKSVQVIDNTNNDIKKSKQLIYYDGEDVGGTVSLRSKDAFRKYKLTLIGCCF